MRFKRDHPIIAAMGDIQIGKIYNFSGLEYLVIDIDFNEIEIKLNNPLTMWKKRKHRNY